MSVFTDEAIEQLTKPVNYTVTSTSVPIDQAMVNAARDQGIMVDAKPTGFDAPLTDFSAEDFRTDYERGRRAGWRDAVEEVKTIVLNRKRNADEATTNDDFLTALGWDEALESILDELRVLPLKDDTKKR